MRKQAYRIVYETMEKNGHSNEVFHQIILGEKNLAARDKSFLKRLGYGTIERAVELDGYLDQVSRIPVRKMDGEVRTVLRMAMYEILYMEQVPEAVSCHEAAELIRWAGKEGQVSFVMACCGGICAGRSNWTRDQNGAAFRCQNLYGIISARITARKQLEK